MEHFFIELSQLIHNNCFGKTVISFMNVELLSLKNGAIEVTVSTTSISRQFEIRHESCKHYELRKQIVKSFVLFCHELYQIEPEKGSVVFYTELLHQNCFSFMNLIVQQCLFFSSKVDKLDFEWEYKYSGDVQINLSKRGNSKNNIMKYSMCYVYKGQSQSVSFLYYPDNDERTLGNLESYVLTLLNWQREEIAFHKFATDLLFRMLKNPP